LLIYQQAGLHICKTLLLSHMTAVLQGAGYPGAVPAAVVAKGDGESSCASGRWVTWKNDNLQHGHLHPAQYGACLSTKCGRCLGYIYRDACTQTTARGHGTDTGCTFDVCVQPYANCAPHNTHHKVKDLLEEWTRPLSCSCCPHNCQSIASARPCTAETLEPAD
jgi:hypothetical protein